MIFKVQCSYLMEHEFLRFFYLCIKKYSANEKIYLNSANCMIVTEPKYKQLNIAQCNE